MDSYVNFLVTPVTSPRTRFEGAWSIDVVETFETKEQSFYFDKYGESIRVSVL